MNNLAKQAIRSNFRAFFEKAFVELHAGAMPEKAPYIGILCGYLEDLDAGKLFTRGIVNLAPRHLKTILCTVCYSAWLLAHHPGKRIMVVTYGEDLSRDIADKIRRIMRSGWYRELFPTRLSSDRFQVTDFTTVQGGGLHATSFGAGMTGRGADVIIIDDAVKVADANNLSIHDRVEELVETEVLNRLNNPMTGRVLIVGHRLHPDDLSGRFENRPGWHQLVLPFIADHAQRIKYGNVVWNRKEGELLRPDAFSAEDVAQKRAMVGPPDFETLFQQNPRGAPWLELTDAHFPEYLGKLQEDAPL